MVINGEQNTRVWCEMSAPVVKYPKAHALWIFKDGNRPSV